MPAGLSCQVPSCLPTDCFGLRMVDLAKAAAYERGGEHAHASPCTPEVQWVRAGQAGHAAILPLLKARGCQRVLKELVEQGRGGDHALTILWWCALWQKGEWLR